MLVTGRGRDDNPDIHHELFSIEVKFRKNHILQLSSHQDTLGDLVSYPCTERAHLAHIPGLLEVTGNREEEGEGDRR